MRRNSLRCFACMQLAAGLIINDIAIHRADQRSWVAPPCRPWQRDREVVLDETTGRPRSLNLVDFATHGVRENWSGHVLAALLAAYPDVLEGAEKPA